MIGTGGGGRVVMMRGGIMFMFRYHARLFLSVCSMHSGVLRGLFVSMGLYVYTLLVLSMAL